MFKQISKRAGLFVGLACMSLLSSSGNAQEKRDAWNNLNILQQNREEANCTLVPYGANENLNDYDGRGFDSSYSKSLNGEWKFRWCSKPAERIMDFYKPEFDDSKWKNITVPANWQMEGFGMPIYINTRYPFPKNQPHAPTDYNPVGAYRRTFTVPSTWSERETYINFDGVESAFYLWVNGQRVGYSQGSRTPAKFNITKYLKAGENSLAVEVYRWCDGSYLECQDFWRLSGIYRDVMLISRAKSHIRDYTVTQTLNNDYTKAVFGLEVELLNLSGKDAKKKISFQLVDPKTGRVGFTGAKEAVASAGKKTLVKFENKELEGYQFWTPETPNLYKLIITQTDLATGKVEERLPQTVGFRKCEIKDGRFKLNGKTVLFRGANRHEHDQFRGHYVLPKDMLEDVVLLKQHNFNAVRNCHYPNAVAWYEICAEKGLMLWDEANLESHGYGYGKASLAKDPKWTEAFVERNQRMVIRSKNCPAIVTWSLGNECGDGINMKAALDWIHQYDPTRPVHSERATFGPNTDIIGTMYASPGGVANYADKKQKRPFILCEYTHAMGNSNGNIKEYFDVFNRDNHAQGGFVWDWIDQGLAQPIPESGKDDGVRPRRFIPVDEWKPNTKTFFAYGGWFENKGRAHDGNFCMNGLINSDRTLHSGIQALKKEQQYFLIKLAGDKQNLTVTNRFHFINPKDDYKAEWEVVDCEGKVVKRGTIAALDLKPGETKTFKLKGFGKIEMNPAREYWLNINVFTAKDSFWAEKGYSVAREQFGLKSTKVAAELTKSSDKLVVTDSDKKVVVKGSNFEITFDRSNGALSAWKKEKTDLVASPMLPNFWRAYNDNDKGAGLQNKLRMWRQQPEKAAKFSYKAVGANVQITSRYELDKQCGSVELTYTVSPAGEVMVDYTFNRGKQKQMLPRVGMTLAMPGSFNRISWYGRGPNSTYNDRLHQPVGVYSSTVEADWEEFSRPQEGGNKTDLRWIKLTNQFGQGLIAVAEKDYLQGSAQFYNARQIDSKQYSWQLRKDGKVWFNIDHAQMGLGGINSWGARPLHKYQLNKKKYSYRFMLKPVLK